MGDITVDSSISNIRMVKTTTLDSLELDRLNLVKIDAQGYEFYVLLGATQVLTELKPVIIIELVASQLAKFNITPKVIVDYMRSMGYHWFYLDYSYPSNHIAVHNDILDSFKQIYDPYILPHTQGNKLNDNVGLGINHKIKLNY
jgi:hypothetical protein